MKREGNMKSESLKKIHFDGKLERWKIIFKFWLGGFLDKIFNFLFSYINYFIYRNLILLLCQIVSIEKFKKFLFRLKFFV